VKPSPDEGPRAPGLAEIRAAAARIRPYAHHTPVLTCAALDEMTGRRLFFKCENFQKVGAFKFRGAANAVFSLAPREALRGVATHSSGNHAQALALAASLRGVAAHIVMPEGSPRVKVAAVEGYGARITFCPPTQADRERTLGALVERTGATFIHPYNDLRVIAGQATCALELLEEVPELDAILVPVGGGGLASGTALCCHYLAPGVKVIAAEPKGADDAFRSLRDGRIYPSVSPRTVADGLRTSLGELTFSILSRFLGGVLTVEEGSIVAAMRHIWERMKLVVEPSAAVPLAALLEQEAGGQAGRPAGGRRGAAVGLAGAGGRVGVILSGGNVDLDALPWLTGI
jgi:threonine dehydratase